MTGEITELAPMGYYMALRKGIYLEAFLSIITKRGN